MRNWLRRGYLAWLLLPFSGLYYLLASLRSILFAQGILPSTRLPVPVIIVGNVFVGGTGKTPLTIWLVEALRAAGYSPAVISRGYGAENACPGLVVPDSAPGSVGDEPLLIAQRTGCPVMVGRNRAAAGLALLAQHPEIDVILSDDGLQHYALQRDLEIVVSDERGNGNGWLLPAGPLREPASRRRDFTVVNGVPHAAFTMQGAGREGRRVFCMQLVGKTAERLADRSQWLTLAEMAATAAPSAENPVRRAVKIVAVAGIGNPARFFTLLRAAGLQFVALPLPDHYDFSGHFFTELDADIILMTEKDAVKCARIERLKNDPRLWVVPVTACIDEALAQQIMEKCRGLTTA